MDINQLGHNIDFFKDYLKKEWKYHIDDAFDKTFTLRHWTVILGYLKHHNGSLRSKKVLHIGSGPGYVLQLLKEFGASGTGIEPFCWPIDGKIDVHKNMVQDILKDKSSLNLQLQGQKFDAIISHDVFTPSVMFNKRSVISIINKLKDHLLKDGSMLFGFTYECPIFSVDDIKNSKSLILDNGFGEEQNLIVIFQV